MGFEKGWEKKDPSSFSGKVEGVKRSDPLKSRLDALIRRIELESRRLEQASARFQERDRALFQKVVDACSKSDALSANVYANEVAAIRRMEKMLSDARLAIEQVAIRARTATGLGDVAVTLSPIVGVMNSIKSGVASVSPQAERELGEISSLLNGILVDAGAVTEMNINLESLDEDSSKIIDEAKVIAESRMSEAFPRLPEGGQQIGEKGKNAQSLKENL